MWVLTLTMMFFYQGKGGVDVDVTKFETYEQCQTVKEAFMETRVTPEWLKGKYVTRTATCTEIKPEIKFEKPTPSKEAMLCDFP